MTNSKKFGILAVSLASIMALGISVDNANATFPQFQLDIKPGSDPNSINPNSKGVIPFALLSDAIWDANDIVPESVMFCADNYDLLEVADCDLVPIHKYYLYDVNRDGLEDFLGYVKTQESGVTCDTTQGKVFGIAQGVDFASMDSIRPVPCSNEV